MINSTLSNTLNVSDLAPKAETRVQGSGSGQGAFGEALAGARTVHDRRESQAAPNSRRDWARGDHAAERTRGQERSAEVRSDRADRPGSNDEVRADDGPRTDAAASADVEVRTDDAAATSASPSTETDATVDTEAAVEGALVTDASASASASAGSGATVAVAAAPVQAALDAIVLPTVGTTTSVATDAVDAAMRLAIEGDGAMTTTANASATAGTTLEVDATLATTVAPGAEDAAAGDVEAGPTRPATSMPVATSGPSPALTGELAVEAEATIDATSTIAARHVAVSGGLEVAAGATTDADAQLVQAVAMGADGGDAETAPSTATATATAAATAAGDDAEEVLAGADVEATVAQAGNRPATATPGPSANAAAQAQVAAQAGAARAAEAGSEEAGDAASPPADAEPLPTQASSVATAARTEHQAPGMRVRGEFAQAALQERIDHIADQLATRLRLSQAAGGSQVQLSLKPRELGEVTVQMNVRDGAVAATILVDKADTLRTLQTNIEELKRSLESQGLSIGEFSVDVRGEAGAGGANARAAAEQRSSSPRGTGAAASGVAGAAAVTPGLSGDREVDPDEHHDGMVSVLA